MKKIFYISAFLYCFIFFGCGGSSGGDSSGEHEEDVVSLEELPALDSGTYIAMGCGITKGSKPTIGSPWPDLLSVKNVHVFNLGVSGTHSAYGVSRIEENMLDYKPSVVMVLYGVNDVSDGIPVADIIANLEQIVQVVQYYGGSVILGTIPIVERYTSSEVSDARSLNSQIEWLCSSYGIECAGVESRLSSVEVPYLDDGYHPTPEGQEAISAAFRSKIRSIIGH